MGNEVKKKGIVDFGDTFLNYYTDRFSDTTVYKIDTFIEHVENNGVWGWEGKVSPSDRVPAQVENQEELIRYARTYKLWHAHIGDPCFEDSWHGNYKVSNWVIHFQYFNNYHIKLLELDFHDPMTLPAQDKF